MKFGLEVLLSDSKRLRKLKGRRVGLVCHPASIDAKLRHSFDLLAGKVKLACAFGPQHGIRGDKQDNMIESPDFVDPVQGVPIFSLYGKVRRPTDAMMDAFDVLLFDLQDIGCRIYTFSTTLLYVMEACAKHGKPVIVLDRPNPAGRSIEGLRLRPGWESFVGAAPLPMRHGLTVGELARYFQRQFALNLDLEIIRMPGYRADRAPGFGWPVDRAWVNPSPNIPSPNTVRVFPGAVLLEGTTLSEGRGTTRPFEIIGAPDLDFARILKRMSERAPQWLRGVSLRECCFEPTFQKHQGKLCHGVQFHCDSPSFRPSLFRPYRAIALLLRIIRELYPEYLLFRDFPYEYVTDKLAFDVLSGGPELRHWIEDPAAKPGDLERLLVRDERAWEKERRELLLY